MLPIYSAYLKLRTLQIYWRKIIIFSPARRLSLHNTKRWTFLLCCQEFFHSLLVISCHQRPDTKRQCALFNCRFILICVLLLQGFYFSPLTNSVDAEEQVQANQCNNFVGQVKICAFPGETSGHLSCSILTDCKCIPRHL